MILHSHSVQIITNLDLLLESFMYIMCYHDMFWPWWFAPGTTNHRNSKRP